MAGRLFRTKTHEEQTTTLASFMPGGRPFLAARLPSTKLRSLLLGLGLELVRVDEKLNDITYEHEIHQTTQLIEEWEKALGIPDHCFPIADTIQERRNNVLIKLGKCGLQTKQDYIDLAALLGFTITVVPGAERGLFPFSYTFPIYLFDRPQSARFTQYIIIESQAQPNVFPFDNTLFPIVFGDNIYTILECLFDQLKPANVKNIYEYVGSIDAVDGALLSEVGDVLISEDSAFNLAFE